MQSAEKDHKRLARKEATARLEAVTAESGTVKSAAIEQRLLLLEEFRHAERVLLYASFGSEVRTFSLIAHCLARKMRTALPKVMKAEDRLRIFEIRDISELRPGCWGIPEPPESKERELQPDELDIIIVPGVAFDEKCNRLGHGKGYYDRLLGSITRTGNPESGGVRPFFVGLAYEEQIAPSLYCGPYDIKMDAVITDKRTIFRDGP